jgi:hypothetical protein
MKFNGNPLSVSGFVAYEWTNYEQTDMAKPTNTLFVLSVVNIPKH